MLHFPPNYLFSQKKVEAQTSMNPHYHWVFSNFFCTPKVTPSVTF